MILTAPEIEITALGKMFYDQSCLYDVENTFNPDHFHAYAPYAKAVQQLHLSKHPVSADTVTTWLTNTNTPFEPSVIEKIDYRAQNPFGIEKDLLFLHELYLKRETIRVCSETIKAVEEGEDIFHVLDAGERNLNGITAGISGNNIKTLAELEKEFTNNQNSIMANDGISGVLSGIKTVDAMFRGIKSPDMVVIAARPGMGKTGLVVSMARNMAVEYKHKVGVFTLEVSSAQLFVRIVSGESEIPSDEIFNGLNKYQLESAKAHMKKIIDANMFFDDTPGLKLSQFRQKARVMVKQMGVEIIIIDYLQLMGGSGDKGQNREAEISEISRGIKQIAKELNIPIIALSQLSRAVETRGGDRVPMLSDLRESGSIEQDADIVGFIYRPEYYGITSDERGDSTEGIAWLIVAKHRNGALGWCKMRFTASQAKFGNVY